MGISETFVKALKENNIITPTEIQVKAIPFLLEQGTDFIGQAQTGTGKTAAFGLPLLHSIDAESDKILASIGGIILKKAGKQNGWGRFV